jgi:hypothetical protein
VCGTNVEKVRRLKKTNFDLKKTFCTFAIHKKKNHMAIIKSALATGAKGKFGNMRLSTQNSRIISATQPGSYRDANTLAQKANRNGMTSLVWFSEFVAPAYKNGFAKYKGIRSEYNEFVSKNKTATQTSTDTEILPVDYANIVVSDGPLSAPNTLTITPNAGSLGLTYTTTLIMPRDEDGDVLCGLFCIKLNPATAIEKVDYAQKEFFIISSAVRQDGTVSFTLPPQIGTGTEVASYLFFKNITSKEASPTTYLEFTAV